MPQEYHNINHYGLYCFEKFMHPAKISLSYSLKVSSKWIELDSQINEKNCWQALVWDHYIKCNQLFMVFEVIEVNPKHFLLLKLYRVENMLYRFATKI